MAGENRQKIKLLKIMEMLMHETDAEHQLTTNDLCVKLREIGIQCDKKTMGKDIAVLREFGYPVQHIQIGHEKGYYLEENEFSTAELKILIDAVQAAGFITETKSNELIEKVASLGGSNKKEILNDNLVCFNITKHTNEDIFKTIDVMQRALREKKRASFTYFDRNENRERVYRKEHERYVVEPMALVYTDDNYYLMCYSAKYKGITNYRIDRMDEPAVEEEQVSEDAIVDDSDIAGYRKQVFKMYGGPITDVTVQFKDKLIGVVQDKFGEDVRIVRIGTDKCVAQLAVQVSPTFWGWLFQFAGEMKIVSPVEMAEEYVKRANVIIENIAEK